MRWLPQPDPKHRYPRVTSARALSALFNVAVGIRLLCPDVILGSPLSPGYRLLDRHFFGDVPLGLALLLFGTVMIAGLYTDRWGRFVDVATWLAMLTWLVVAVDIALVSLSQIGTFAYALIAAMHGYAYAHVAGWRDQLRREQDL